jgi:ATP adenylyltransferase
MERLWTPWRLSYVTGASGALAGCIFCEAAVPGGKDDELVLVRGQHAYVILNRYPYNNGHLMVVLNRHVPSLEASTPAELIELMRLTRHAEMALNEGYRPHGMNVGINIGRTAGAGVVDHLHIHLVPRWNGDTSFMSTVGNVRVLPEELGQTAERLRPLFDRQWKDDPSTGGSPAEAGDATGPFV